MTNKPIKTALHHWWPTGLAAYWVAADNMVSVLQSSGKLQKAPAGAYGAITSAHHVKFDGPWSSDFEPVFSGPDGEIADFVSWVRDLTHSDSEAPDRSQMVDRIKPETLSHDRLHQMASIAASLIARSPRTRNEIEGRMNYWENELDLPKTTDVKSAIARQQKGLYEAYKNRMVNSGKWAIMSAAGGEFVAGDGFFHNFPASPDLNLSNLKLVLPILPDVAVAFMNPQQYPTDPQLVSIALTPAQTEMINDLTQVYAKKFLFFRNSEPQINDSFKLSEHQQYEYHRYNPIDELLDNLSQFCNWGLGGSAMILPRKFFSAF